MITMKIFTPLTEQPEPVYGAEELWLSWKDDVIIKDNFGWYVEDKVEHPPLGGTYTDDSCDALSLNVDFAEVTIPFVITNARVICQDGVWGWVTEATEAQP